MKHALVVFAAISVIPFSAFAVDGQVLINQSTVMAAGGFPYTISQPGSYKLSGKLTVSTRTAAIIIAASNVTLDLNGFTIEGPPDTCINCAQVSGVMLSGLFTGITVRNGIISGYAGGLNLSGASLSILEDLKVLPVAGAVVSTPVAIGPYSVMHKVVTSQSLSPFCPVAVSDSTAQFLNPSGAAPNSCKFQNVIGFLF